eukprot:1159865-Pelagomonas_calceolata.AAC.8
MHRDNTGDGLTSVNENSCYFTACDESKSHGNQAGIGQLPRCGHFPVYWQHDIELDIRSTPHDITSNGDLKRRRLPTR